VGADEVKSFCAFTDAPAMDDAYNKMHDPNQLLDSQVAIAF
jgi:hypothetical protein